MRFVRSMSAAAALARVTSKTTSGFLYQSWLTLPSPPSQTARCRSAACRAFHRWSHCPLESRHRKSLSTCYITCCAPAGSRAWVANSTFNRSSDGKRSYFSAYADPIASRGTPAQQGRTSSRHPQAAREAGRVREPNETAHYGQYKSPIRCLAAVPKATRRLNATVPPEPPPDTGQCITNTSASTHPLPRRTPQASGRRCSSRARTRFRHAQGSCPSEWCNSLRSTGEVGHRVNLCVFRRRTCRRRSHGGPVPV